MKDFLIYIAQSGICLSFFGIVYILFLRKQTFFKFNRIFLLSGMLVSFTLPSIQLSYDVIVANGVSLNVAMVDDNKNLPLQKDTISLWQILSAIYLLGIGVVIARNLKIFNHIYKIKKTSTVTREKGYKLIVNNTIKTPFSILNQVFINTEKLQKKEKEIILKHEISHIHQKHWIDLICSECALLLQWFNPLMWYYIHLQKENHEYLADQAVLRDGESTDVYRAVLINQRFQGPVFSFANSFNYSNQQNRLNMMKKTKTSPWKKIAVLMVLPLMGVFLALSAKPNYVIKDELVQIEVQKETVEGKIAGITYEESSKKDTVAIKVVGFKTEKGEKPLIIIDDVEKPNAKIEDIPTETIKEVHVYKGDKYGDKGKYGVIAITTKEKADKTNMVTKFPEDALYIVDDKVVENIEHINPSEIETLSILKNKVATEVYGEKGKNGVIIITTKK